MGKIIEKLIDRFDGGMVQDIREKDFRYARLIKNFDAHSFPHKLVPLRDTESGDSGAATVKKENFCLAYWNPTGSSSDAWKIFGLGVKVGASSASILMKDVATGIGSSDLDDAGWDTPAGNESAGTTTNFNLFIYYKLKEKIYGARDSRYIYAFTPDGATGWDDTAKDLGSTFTHITQGLIHSKDDTLYFGVDNVIIKYDGTTWSTSIASPALKLPSQFKITSLAEYGNYLAIACAPVSGVGKSIVYLWDRDSSLATLSESIDWGEGNLQILEEVDGYLIGISYISSALGGLEQRVIFRYLSGTKALIFKQFILSSTSTVLFQLPIAKQKINNSLFFLMSLTLDGVRHQGLWKLARTGDSFSIVMDTPANNDTAIEDGAASLKNFFIYSDCKFISYVTAASAYAVSKTNDQASYTASSIYESLKIGDAKKKLKLISVGVMAEPLPADGSVVLKYKKDADTSWTTIFTHTTDDSLFHEAINIESSGVTLPQFKEIQFQVISTGGAVITGIWCKYEEIEDGLTSKI